MYQPKKDGLTIKYEEGVVEIQGWHQKTQPKKPKHEKPT